MAHVSATIPWEEGKEEDFKELREGLEKIRAGEQHNEALVSATSSWMASLMGLSLPLPPILL